VHVPARFLTVAPVLASFALDPLGDLTPLLLAVLIGGLIGFERESHGRPAGLRTHIIVCLVSTLLICASRHVPDVIFGDAEQARIVFDPNRLGAGILTGIGFLGAATVIRSGDIVRGITTGATVWSVAGIGVVLGQGEYTLALTATGIMFVSLVGLDRVANSIKPVLYRRLIVRGEPTSMAEITQRIKARLEQESVRVMDLTGKMGHTDDHFELVFHVRARDPMAAPEILKTFAAEEGVISVEWASF